MNKMTGQTSIIGEELNTSKNFNCSIAGNIKDTNEEFEEATKKNKFISGDEKFILQNLCTTYYHIPNTLSNPGFCDTQSRGERHKS